MHYLRAMNERRNQANPAGAIQLAVLLCLIIPGSILVAGVLATYAYQALDGTGVALEGLLLGRGPHKLMRRIAMLILLLTVPILLRRYCWRGIRDLGMGSGIDWRAGVAGLLLGVTTLGAMALWTAFRGYRQPDLSVTADAAIVTLSRYALSAVVVGVFEEILTRGILFRSLARLWGPWLSGVATSLLFAVGHFVSPDPDAFTQGPLLSESLSVVGSIWPWAAAGEHVWMQMLNLTLMGGVMCVLVARTGTIWFAAGLHAGWVFVKLSNSFLMDINQQVPHSIWVGHRSDNLDSIVCTLMLVSLMVCIGRIPMHTVRAWSREGI